VCGGKINSGQNGSELRPGRWVAENKKRKKNTSYLLDDKTIVEKGGNKKFRKRCVRHISLLDPSFP
jgi:hypothetical protein